MGKKLIAIIVILLCLCNGLTCFATSTKVFEKKQAVVKAKCVDNTKEVYKARVGDGESEIDIDDTKVKVEDIPDQALYLVVIKIDEVKNGEAWNWVNSCINDESLDICPYNIFFEDQDGNYVTVEKEPKVTVDIDPLFESPLVYSLNSQGQTTEVSHTKSGNSISFKKNSDDYYVIAEKVVTKSNVLNEDTVNDKSPQTSDNCNDCIFFVLLLISFTLLVVFTKTKKEN